MQLVTNEYQIQGVSIPKICHEFGTPLYIYDAEKILTQYERLKKSFEGIDLAIKYAAKSLTNINIIKLLRKAGSELDVVSIQEAYLGLKAGFEPQQILFTPNCVSFDEIREAVELGLVINIDNIPTLEKFSKAFGHKVACCIRVNPHIVAGANKNIQVAHPDSKFGISIEHIKQVLRLVESQQIKVIGLHMHTGSDILDSSLFLESAQVLFNIAHRFKDLLFMNLGSGFKVAYKANDIMTNIEELGKHMREAFQNFCASYGKKLALWFEPGKFIVSESGLFVAKTNVVKHTPTSTVLIGLDSGFNHLVRPMMYGAHHDIFNLSNPEGVEKLYTVVGYICETDTFGSKRRLHEVRENDLIGFKNAGAYCFSMSSNYNSRYKPAEVLVMGGKAKLIRKRETFQDLIRHQIDIFSQD